jgi:PAS domain S-box-containing protein
MTMGARGYSRLIHPADRAHVVAYVKNRRSLSPGQADGETSGVIEYRAKHKSGEYRWVAQSSTTIWGRGQRPIAEIGTVRDITEGKQAEEAVRAASRMEATATLAGGIAHDFNNLMVGVLGNAELLQMHVAHDADAMRMLSTIAKSAQQAGELAHQMLAFARGGKYEPQLMDLNEVIRNTLRLEEHCFPPRIRIERHMDPRLRSIKADPVQIGQVVMNLSINAVEAIPETGRISITTRNVAVGEAASAHPGMIPGPYVCLAVEDTGHGMGPETVAHVFEPFFTTKFQGRGLGLAAAYGIVKNHGGHILVHSEQGHGARFEVFLPAVEDKPIPGAKTAAPTPAAETILVIDDEPIVLNVTREILERLGYHVLCAHDGQEAVGMARTYEGEIHLAVLDMGMPILGGAQAFPLLKAARPMMRVIISSGYELDPAAQTLLDAGASAFIHKPFRSQVLASKIRMALAGQ